MKHLLIASGLILLPCSAAFAQDAGSQPSSDARVRVGLGAKVQPRYIGSDDSEIAPMLQLKIARHGKQFHFGAPDDAPGIAIITKDGFSFGPSVNLASGRKDKDVGAPVGRVKTTIEAGAFAQYEAGDSFRVRGELRKGLGGHDGLIGDIGADKIWRDGDRYVFSIGPRVLFSDSRYQRAYFGVTPAAALATGLPVYRPGGGVHAVALTTGLTYQFNDRFGMFGFGRYERLVGDAAKSPIVREFGSRNQFSAGAGLSYTFNMKI
ncbi:MAG: MipA/OmpV family protein [Sphingomicrobium sp.]